jgi:PAS domain S-box-containing protein
MLGRDHTAGFKSTPHFRSGKKKPMRIKSSLRSKKPPKARESEQEVSRLNRLYAVLSQVNRAIVRESDRNELLATICRVLVEFGRFHLVTFGEHDEAAQRVRFVVRAGADIGYLDEVSVFTDDRPEGRDPVGTSIREDRSDVSNDIFSDARMAPFQPAARRYGLHASASFPIHLRGEVWGALSVYDSEPGVFRDKEVELLEEVAGDVAFALEGVEKDAERRLAQAALTESEARFSSAFQYAAVGMALVAPDGRWLKVNGAVCSVLGYTEEELLARTFQEITHPDDLHADLELVRQMLTGEIKTYQMEKRYWHKSGREVWALLSVSLVRDSKDQPLYFISQIQDITHRRQSEETLRSSEERYRKLADNFPAGTVATYDLDLRLTFVAGSDLNRFGLTAEILLGKHFTEFAPTDAWAIAEPCLKEACQGKTVVYEAPHYDGHVYRVTAAPLYAADGSVGEILVVSQNITEQKRAEEDLRMRDRAINATTEGICITTSAAAGAELIYVNQGFERLTGYRAEAVLGRNMPFLQGVGTSAEAIDRLWAAFEAEQACTLELLNYRKDCTPFWNRLSITPVRSDTGAVTHFVAILNDVTQEKESELALRESEARRKEAQALGRMGDWEFDVQAGQVNWSDEVFKLYERDLAQGQPTYEEVLAYYFPDTLARLHERVQNSIDTGEGYELELHVCLPSGREAFHYSAGRALKDNQGKVVKVFGVVQDITERKRAEKALYRSEERLKDAQAVGRIGDWEFDVQTGQIAWSDELFRLFSRDTATGPPTIEEMWTYYFPEDALQLQQYARRAIETGEGYQLDLHVRLPDGREAYHYSIGHASKDSKGRVVKLHGIAQDISERKRAEEALRVSERDQRQLARQLDIERARLIQAQAVANVGSWEAELPSLNVIWSEQTHRIFETDPSRFHPTRSKFREFIHPEDRARVDAAFAASLAKRSPCAVEYRIIMPDGRVKIIEERWQTSHDEQGQPVRAAGTCLDITDRVRSEDESRAAHQRLVYHVENSPLAVVEWDPGFRVRRWSRHAEELFGWRAEEVMGLSPADWPFVHPDDWPTVRKTMAGPLQAMEPRNFGTNRNYTKDGRLVHCEWYNSALLGRDGSLVSILSLVHDVTQRKQAEEAALQSQQQLRALSARVEMLREEERTRISREIHDELGQMLTGIKMDLRWIEHRLDNFGDDQRLNPILDKLVATAELTDEITKTVQRMAADLRPGILDKLGLVTALQDEAARFEKRSGIPCRILGPSDLPPMQDKASTAFFRIFQEALTNVIRHAKATAVEAELQVQGGGCRLEIRDNGKGITGVDLAKPTSLGLLGMQERARLLGGDVSFAPQSTGGTIVTVQIPNGPDPSESV